MVYEDFFILIMGAYGRNIDAFSIYLMLTLFLGVLIARMRKDYHVFTLAWQLIPMFVLLFFGFGLMIMSGWFHDLQLWYLGLGSDPHNYLWALSKLNGLVLFFPIVVRGEKTEF